jgi:DNA-binding response OmpR family regulator
MAMVCMVEVRKKILCIEDDRETAKLIAEELCQRGFNPVIAYDGRVGLAAILKRIPDLVLCDVSVPEMSGFEVLAYLNECVPRLNRIPFVFLTGLSGRFSELQGRDLGADDYVTKPIDFDILEAIVRARLAGPIARHEIAARLAEPNGRHAVAPSRGAHDRTSSKRAMLEQIVELTDAPTVEFDLDSSKSLYGSTAEEETAVRDLRDRLTKP